jgi:hypothetical protein
MSTAFLSQNIWPEITKTVLSSQKPCYVAVAYFAQDSSRRLPLPSGSRLVVDASKAAVASGQTCPADLAVLQKRDVRIYSVPNLHAKVFVMGRTAYIGSANVSENSAHGLIEAVIHTTEPSVVSDARDFVKEYCLHELGPETLKGLAAIYQPPKGGGRGPGPKDPSSVHPTLPRLLTASLTLVDMSEQDLKLEAKAKGVAKKRRKHPRSWQMDNFRYIGKCPFAEGDKVIQITDEGHDRIMVAPPADVIHVHPPEQQGNTTVTFVYLERPERKRRQLRAFARSVGCAQSKLRCNSVIRNPAFKQALLKAWSVTL